MKNFYLTLTLCLFAVSTFAKDLKILSGDLCPILEAPAEALVEFDYSKTTWEEEESYKSFCGEDYEHRVQDSYDTFIFKANSYENPLKFAQESSAAKYKIIIKLDDIERHQGMSMWGRMYIEIRGEIEIFDIEKNESICKIKIKDLSGGEDFAPDDRLKKCFTELAEEFIELCK